MSPTRTPIDDEIAARVRRRGPLPFDEVMGAALYDPELGFYSGAGSAGRRGDFLTSPEVGPLFGAVIAGALDDWWRALGEPDPFVVVEAAAGVGTLAKAVLAAEPACTRALTYVLVEQSAAMRARHADHLVITDATLALPPSTGPDGEATATGSGPRVVSLGELPALACIGVVLANELLDNLPVRLAEWTGGGWSEVRVGLADDTDDGQTLVEFLVPADDVIVELAERLVPEPQVGARIPVQAAALAWLRQAFDVIDRGGVVLFDYGDVTPALADRPMPEWLRTYRRHERGGDPLVDLGLQDITCEVAFDQLQRVRPADRQSPQAEYLRRQGIDALVDEGRRIWHERAHVGDLTAMKARSRVREAEALLDMAGLGAFQVLEWAVDVPLPRPE